jgi:hypothetical protein
MLTDAVTTVCPKVTDPVIDQMWLLIRPTYSWIRTTKLGQAATEKFTPLVIPPDTLDYSQARFPLEPFNRSWNCLIDEGLVGDQGWADRYIVAQADRSAEEKLICACGHIQTTYGSHARRFKNEDFHCVICTGSRAIAGLNTLADLMPKIAAEWDSEANGDLTPFMVTPGCDRKVGWRCTKGHPYKAYINNRVLRGTACPFCARKAILVGYNDLATTHPKEVQMWDKEAAGNPKPTEVSAGNNTTKIFLLCHNGHPFCSTPARLVKTGGRCKRCAGTVLVPGGNDLATLRPDVAAWWHPTKNGDLTPNQIRPFSDKTVWWKCPDGHEFPSTVSHRSRQNRQTCPADTGRLLIPGFNDVASKEPDLTKDWNTTLNGIDADQTVAGSVKRCWTCAHGHTQWSTVANRRSTGGCTDCPPDDRVDIGQREFSRGRNGWDKRKRRQGPPQPLGLAPG